MAEERKKYIDFTDMFDGGGPGRPGPQFEGGGIISAIGNALGGPSIFGDTFKEDPYRVKHEKPVPLSVDMRDGGGIGYRGSRFRGAGIYSVLANALGITPLGAEELIKEMDEKNRLAEAAGTVVDLNVPTEPDFEFPFLTPYGNTAEVGDRDTQILLNEIKLLIEESKNPRMRGAGPPLFGQTMMGPR